ncbi:MAG: terminase family protein, partial [Acidaminococcaceae bacterium]
KVQAPVQILKYQEEWVNDNSRFKICDKGRQTGFSFCSALEVVLDAVAHKTMWVILSAGERQSKEYMEKVKLHAMAVGIAAEILQDTFKADKTDYKLLEVKFPNGSRVIGLPANPDTARGFSGNVVLDEFAFHRDSRKIWTALLPTITRGYKARVISTPNGKSGKFYELWCNDDWSKHFVTIYRAKEDGLDVDIEALRAACDSEDDFLQEYCGVFLDEASAMITYEMINSCEDESASVELPEDFEPLGELYLGMDIGRKRDLSVIWIDEKLGDVFWTRMVLILKKMPFRLQRETLYKYLELPKLRRACIDSTGIGAQLAEEAREKYGSKVEEVTFTPAAKEDLALYQKQCFEDKLCRVPAIKEIRNDLHAVKKIITSANNIRYDADRNENGHADRFWASALAKHAGKTNFNCKTEYESLQKRRVSRREGGY